MKQEKNEDNDGNNEQQQQMKQEKDGDNDGNNGQQQKMDDVINASMAKRVGDTHQSDEKNENPRPAERQRLLPAHDL